MTQPVTLGELKGAGDLDFGDGYRTRADQLASEGFRILRAADVLDGAVSLTGPDFVGVEHASAIGSKRAQAGDVVLTSKGTVGRVARMPALNEPVVYSPQLCYFRPRVGGRLEAAYLQHWLHSAEFAAQAGFLMHNTDMAPYISLRDLSSMRISLPPLPEQRAIAEVLGALDDKIAANEQLAATCSALAIALAAGASSQTSVCELASMPRSPMMPSADLGGGIHHYSIPAFDEAQMPARDSAEEVKSAKFRLTEACVLVSKLNPRFPRIWAVDELTGLEGWASTEFMPCVPREISHRLLWSVLAQPAFRMGLASKVAGTSGSHQRVKPEDILKAEVLDPRTFEFAAVLRIESLVELSTRARVESRTLAALRDTLLPELMSGRLSVKDAERAVEDAL